MYLPSDEQDWDPVNPDNVPRILAGLNQHIAGTRGAEDLLSSGGQAAAGSESGPKLKVSAVAQRALTFYESPWTLYRFTCEPGELSVRSGYEPEAYLFAVCAPQDEAWLILDWTVAAIDELNRRAGLKLTAGDGAVAAGTAATPQAVRDYLRFFVSFLGGARDQTRAILPFILPGEFADLGWDDDLPVALDVFIGEQNFAVYTPLSGVDRPDPPDSCDDPAGERAADLAPVAEALDARSDGAVRTSREHVEQVCNASRAQPHPVPLDAPTEAGEQGGSAAAATASAVGRFAALVWYGDALFKTEFEVRAAGKVEMLTDEVVEGGDGLPVPRWEVRDEAFPVPLLCRQKPREEVSAATLMARIAELSVPAGQAGQEGHAGIRLHRLRVQDTVKLQGPYPAPVRLNDVEFIRDVILDEAVFEHSLDFTECRFLGRLSARQATIKGGLRLDESRFDGIDPEHTKGDPPKAMLDLWGVVAEGGLFADRVHVFGRVRAQCARIGTVLRARGLQIHPRRKGGDDLDGEVALDCSHTQVTGSLDLRCWTAKNALLGERTRRTVIGRSLVLKGLSACEANLDGIWVNAEEKRPPVVAADMRDVRITGTLSAVAAALDNESRHPAEAGYWRARFNGNVLLDHAELGSARIDGSDIARSLSLHNARLRGSVFARRSEHFRCRIGEVLQLSGARVVGDIDFSSARVGGEIQYITGRCGRLRAMVEPWPQWQLDAQSNEYRLVPRLCASEASGILLQDLSVESGIDLAGIRLGSGTPEFSGGGLIATGVRVGGGLHFWRKDAKVRLSQRIKRDLVYERYRAHIPEDDRDFGASMEDAITGVSAELAGTLDLCGIETGGTLDLGRCKVQGQILLENARVGGNLRAWVEDNKEKDSCTTIALIADSARIEGDADLRGLAIRPRGATPALLKARDLRVTGKLWLAEPDPSKAGNAEADGAPFARLYGEGARIELEGAQAAQLSFSGKCIDDPEPREEARIVLARCRVGQLSVWGFTTRHFPHPVDMTAIDTGDWNGAAPFENIPKLLTATRPFDGRNYVDVEHRLARVGQEARANAVYRSMAWRAAPGWGARLRYRISGCFSANGTRPFLMVFWLVLSMLPVLVVLADPRNVEFVMVEMDDRHEAAQPSEPRRDDHVGGREWGWIRATGLALGYAVPLFTADEADVARARLDGRTCLPGWLGGANASDRLPPCSPTTCRSLGISPHEFALCLAVVQFMLWIAIAANLPTILRRRQ